MAIGAYGLPTQALVSLALLQCGTQGVLVSLLANFLASKSDHQAWFKVYVVSANILTAGQTVVHVMQAFETIDLAPVRMALVAAAPVLTGLIGALVHAFFIYRCWRIYRQRLLPIIPLLLLYVVSLVSAIMIGAYLAQSLILPPDQVAPGAAISTEVWSFSSLAFDTVTTCSTVIYFFGVCKDLNARPGVLLVVWQILWASAAPPLILMIISIVDEYMVQGSPGIVGVIAIGMMGKFYVLSLMINVAGQGYIRQQFERRWATPTPPRDMWFRKQRSQAYESGRPAVHVTVHTEEIELTTGIKSVPENIRREESLLDKSSKEPSDVASLKCNEARSCHIVHNVKLSPEREL